MEAEEMVEEAMEAGRQIGTAGNLVEEIGVTVAVAGAETAGKRSICRCQRWRMICRAWQRVS